LIFILCLFLKHLLKALFATSTSEAPLLSYPQAYPQYLLKEGPVADREKELINWLFRRRIF